MTIAATIKPQTGAPIRVQLIDDSAVVRGLTRRWLTGVDGIELVVVSTDGRDKSASGHNYPGC